MTVEIWDGLSEAEITALIKADAERVRESLPTYLLEGVGKRQMAVVSRRSTRRQRDRATLDAVESTYNGLEGEWSQWLEVARRYEHRVPAVDRQDFRHDLLLRLAIVRSRRDTEIPQYLAYRIASYSVADYYRQRGKLRNNLDCKHCPTTKRQHCRKYGAYSECHKLVRVVSLEAEIFNTEGEPHSLLDTLADDHAVDIDQWLDAQTWLNHCPARLVEVAHKIVSGERLATKDRKYLSKMRHRAQKSLF